MSERPKRYRVTFGWQDEHGKRAMVGIEPKLFDKQGALDRAHQLILEGKPNVMIGDGDGHQISGDDLVACCNGKKTLTDDLRAV